MNIATFHAYAGFSPSYEFGSRVMRGHAARLHGRIAVSAAARHFIDRFFPGDYKVIPNGVDIARFASAVPHRALAGRHAEHPVRRPARAAQGPARPAQGVPHPAQDRLRLPAPGRRHRAPGARGAPLRATRRLQGVEFLGRVSDAEKAQLFRTARRLRVAGDRRRVVRDRAARGDGRRHADRVHRHPRLQGRRPPRPRGPARPAPRAQGARGGHRPRSSASRASRAMGAAGRQRAEEFSWERVTAKVEDYYGFVIRRLAASGQLPAGLPCRRSLQAPPGPREARPVSLAPARSRRRASGSRQTQAGRRPRRQVTTRRA